MTTLADMELVKTLIYQMDTRELAMTAALVNDREKELRYDRNVAMGSQFKPGSRVRFITGRRGQFVGHVVKVNTATATVQAEPQCGGKRWRVAITLLKLVEDAK